MRALALSGPEFTHQSSSTLSTECENTGFIPGYLGGLTTRHTARHGSGEGTRVQGQGQSWEVRDKFEGKNPMSFKSFKLDTVRAY